MPHTPLWDFAVAYYGKDGVSEACLDLQDRLNVDIPFLICGAWLGLMHIPISDADIVRLDGAVLAWREQVIQPLRALRRLLKSGPSPAPNHETGRLRDSIKGSELKAERLEIDLLAGLSKELVTPNRDTAAEIVPANLKKIIEHFTGKACDTHTASTLAMLAGVALTFQD